METVDQIRTEWKTIRRSLGNLICFIEGKLEKFGDIEDCWNKGYKRGYKDAELEFDTERWQSAYAKGLEDAWETACRIVQMDVHKRAEVFFSDSEAVTHDEPFKHYSAEEAMQKLKEYDAIIRQVTHSNAQKFVEVFGFMPGYEIMDDGRSYFPCFEDEFWNAEYKEPPEE